MLFTEIVRKIFSNKRELMDNKIGHVSGTDVTVINDIALA
jgi:hypothetical protein